MRDPPNSQKHYTKRPLSVIHERALIDNAALIVDKTVGVEESGEGRGNKSLPVLNPSAESYAAPAM